MSVIRWIPAALMLTSLPAPALADSPLHSAILGRYKQFTRALQRKDPKFLETYFASDFSAALPNGQAANRDDAIKGLTDLINGAKNLQWTWKVSEPSVGSRGAVVITDGLMKGRVMANNAWHKVEIAGRTEDVWSMGDHDWQLRSVRWISVSVKADGKIVPAPPGIFGTAPAKS